MLTDLGYFAAIGGIFAILVLVTFWILRVIDHHYRNAEQDREYAYEAMLQNDAYVIERFGKRQELELGYKYNRQLMQGFCDRTKQMSLDVIRQINDSTMENAKKMFGMFNSEE